MGQYKPIVEKELDNVLRRNTLYHLGLKEDVAGFKVSIAAFACMLLIQNRENEILDFETFPFTRHTSETLLDDLMDIGINVDNDYYDILRQIQDEEYISIDDEDRCHSEDLSLVLINIFSLVYPTMDGLLLVAYFLQTAEEVNSMRKSLGEAIQQVESVLKNQGVSVDFQKMPNEFILSLEKIVLYSPQAVIPGDQANGLSFKTVCRERSIKREKTIAQIKKNMGKIGELPVLPFNQSYIKQQMSQSLYSTADISETILCDVGIILNILKNANKNKRKKSTGTISHAIMLLGNEQLDKIIETSTSLNDIENADLKRELEYIFVSAYMSKCITERYAMKSEIRDTEEMCVCSMIHNMGQMIVLYYYPEAYYEIKRMARKNKNKRKAAKDIIGTTYDNIGIYFAMEWNFPFNVIESLRVCYFNRVGKTKDNLIVNLPFCSTELCAFLGKPNNDRQTIRLREFVNSLNIFSRELSNLLDKSWTEVTSFSKKQNISIKKRDLSEISTTG